MNLTKDQQKNTMLCRGRNRILVLAFGVEKIRTLLVLAL
jgi:hypothetical protein